MTVYGYARVSTKKQVIDRQIKNIKSINENAIIIQDKFTGTKLDRPNFTKLLSKVKTGDTIIFDEVSRMSRDAKEGFKLYKKLFDEGINLIFIKEPHINTTVFRDTLNTQVPTTGTDVDIILNAVNEYLMKLAEKQIELAFIQAQKEVDFLRTRTKEGLKQAELNGKKGGRRVGSKSQKVAEQHNILKAEIIEKSKFFNGTNTDKDMIKILGISRGTYYTLKKELLECSN